MSLPHPGSVVDQHGRPLDQVRLTGIRAKGYHGVLDHERAEGQVFVADVVVHLDTRRAAAGDDLSLTLSYATLAEQVVEVIEGPAVQLVETLAEQIASVVMDHAIVGAVDVFVHKPHAPVPVPFDDVVVAVHRDRTKLPAARFDPQALPATSVGSLPSLRDERAGSPAVELAATPLVASPAEPLHLVEEPSGAAGGALESADRDFRADEAPGAAEPADEDVLREAASVEPAVDEPASSAPLPGGGAFAGGAALSGAHLSGGMTFPPSTDVLGDPVLPTRASLAAAPEGEPAAGRRLEVDPLDATIEMPVALMDHAPDVAQEAPAEDAPAPVEAGGPEHDEEPAYLEEPAAIGGAAPADELAPVAAAPVDAFAPADATPSEATAHESVQDESVQDENAQGESAAPADHVVTLADVPRRTSAFAALRERDAEPATGAEADVAALTAAGAQPATEQTDPGEHVEPTQEPAPADEVPDLIPFPDDEPVALLGELEWNVPEVEPAGPAAPFAAVQEPEHPAPDDQASSAIPGHPFDPVTPPEEVAAAHVPLAELPETDHPFTPVTAPELADAVTGVPLVAETSAHPFAPVTPPALDAVPDVEADSEPVAGHHEPAPTSPEEPRERDRMDEVPPEPVRAILALGANLGDARETLRQAVRELESSGVIDIEAVAPLARTAAVGGPEQPDYLNTVIMVRTFLAPRELLHLCQHIEQVHGRVRTEHWGPRTLDIDIITYGQVTGVADDLELPHPRAHERAFVLQPWDQIEPGAVLPGLGGGPVDALAATAPDRQGVRWLALDWLDEQPGEGAIEDVPPTPVQPTAPTPFAEEGPGQ